MAIISHPADFAETGFKVSPKTAQVVLYSVIGFIAAGVAITAAMATGEVGVFEECYSSCVALTQ